MTSSGDFIVKHMKLIALVVLTLLIGGEWLWREAGNWPLESQATSSGNSASLANPELQHAYDQQLSNIWIQGTGEVIKLLPDDNDGSRHQRFLLKVNLTQTLLIAHNIDLADRLDALAVGDHLEFYGEYEWNKKGGVLHWTHHDPAGKKAGGWIKHNGITYQ